MGKKKLEPFQYYLYGDDNIPLAKRGGIYAIRDIYRYNIYGNEKHGWEQYNFMEDAWVYWSGNICRKSSEASHEDLKKAGIPLLDENLPDETIKLIAEANKKKQHKPYEG